MPGCSAVLIGNSPSSGSTLLADLLDSTTVSLCGPEIGLFSSANFYAFDHNRRDVLQPYRSSSIHPGGRCGVFFNALAAYGLNRSSLQEQIEDAENIDDFLTGSGFVFQHCEGKILKPQSFSRRRQLT